MLCSVVESIPSNFNTDTLYNNIFYMGVTPRIIIQLSRIINYYKKIYILCSMYVCVCLLYKNEWIYVMLLLKLYMKKKNKKKKRFAWGVNIKLLQKFQCEIPWIKSICWFHGSYKHINQKLFFLEPYIVVVSIFTTLHTYIQVRGTD